MYRPGPLRECYEAMVGRGVDPELAKVTLAHKIAAITLRLWKRGELFEFTSKTLSGEFVGLEEIDDGIWTLYYGPVLLARFDEREMKFHG